MVSWLRRVRARLAAAGLVLIAGWEIGVLVSARQAEPSAEDWRAAARSIPASLDTDQLIVFAPRWLDPVGRLWLGDRMSIAQVARMDTARYRDIWEVSVRGASAGELEGRSPVSDQAFGPLRVRRFVGEPAQVTWSLSDGAPVCEIDFEPRRGVTFDLQNDYGQAMRTFRSVPLGNELQVYAGLADYQKRARNRSTAVIQVLVDGLEVGRAFAGNDDGWVAVPAAATVSGVHDVAIIARVQNPRGVVDLSVCVAAEGRTRRR
ncbi:MAG TPA: hypothetical protein VM032_08710 [Vicinamibacterales bacterium]|nr:hypothetical protein [Vicinamibacterales bacterium]